MSEVEFELRKLGDLIEIFNNKRVPLSAKQREGLEKIYPYYGAQGIVDYVDDYIFDGKYILIAEDGENLKTNNKSICTLATGKYWVNNHAHIIQGIDETNTDFLYYKLNSISFAPYITGSAQPKLNKENLLNIELYVPSKEYQDKIAKVLTLLDQKIQINNQINQELEAMAKTLYDYWFVQFDFPDQNGKPYKSSGGKMVYNPELKREIPEGWGVEKLGDISQYVTEKVDSFELNIENYVGTDNMIADMGGIEFTTSIPKSGTSTKFSVGDILISNIRPYFKKIWLSDRTGGCSADVLCIRTNRIISKEFVYATLARDDFFNYDVAGSKGSKMPRGDKKHIMEYPIVFEFGIAEQYSKIVKPIYEAVHENNNQNQELTQLRDWLLPMLMNGQVKVE